MNAVIMIIGINRGLFCESNLLNYLENIEIDKKILRWMFINIIVNDVY